MSRRSIEQQRRCDIFVLDDTIMHARGDDLRGGGVSGAHACGVAPSIAIYNIIIIVIIK